MIGAAWIVTSANGIYRPDPAGEWAAIVAVHGRFGELADLVAWLPRTPQRWWLRLADEPILGAHALAFAADCGKRIRILSPPEQWLRARGADEHHQNVCILNWGVDLRSLFHGVEIVVCDTPGLARRLREKLREWEPKVRHAT